MVAGELLKSKRLNMIRKIISSGIVFVSFAFFVQAQPSIITKDEVKQDTAYVNSLIKQATTAVGNNPDTAIILATQAKDLAEKLDFLSGKAYAFKYLGNAYFYKGQYIETLENWNEALKVFEEIKDQTGIANILSNMANVYNLQGSEEKALDYALRSLSIAENLGNKLRTLTSLNAVAFIYYGKEETKGKALEYLLRALPLAEDLKDSLSLGTISENIGEIYYYKNDYVKAAEYFNKSINVLGYSENSAFAYNGLGKLNLEQKKYDEAYKYHSKALQISEDLGSKPNIVKSLDGIANIYAKQKDFKSAIVYYKKAVDIGEEMNFANDLKELYSEMAFAYSDSGLSDYKNAFKYQQKYSSIKDTLYTNDIAKKLGRLQFDFDLKKKDGEITLLEKDNAITDQKLQRQRLFKNAFMIGLFLAFIIALLIFRSYRIKAKTHKILDRQKNEIEGLLLNILPKEVAGELQRTGHATPKHYDSASVMFTDFKSFTVIADNMSPKELVEELDACFIAFDGIIEKYQLEKIKTIGDSYMCAGGIPTPDATHVLKIVKAGLEIQHYISEYNQKRQEKGLEPWNIRIGIHVGPIVAGVVGKKKYAYDIWGSTVNIASRMESNGEPGKVNISSATYELIKDYYECSYRGKISAKNIGEIDMYFIDHEHTIPKTLLLNEKEEISQ